MTSNFPLGLHIFLKDPLLTRDFQSVVSLSYYNQDLTFCYFLVCFLIFYFNVDTGYLIKNIVKLTEKTVYLQFYFIIVFHSDFIPLLHQF